MTECLICSNKMVEATDNGLCSACISAGYKHDHSKCPKTGRGADGKPEPPPNHLITQDMSGQVIGAVAASLWLVLLLVGISTLY